MGAAAKRMKSLPQHIFPKIKIQMESVPRANAI